MPEIIGYDQPIKPREYLAQETVDCRLARIPLAEGCERPGSGNCGIVTDESLMGNQLIRLPPVEGQMRSGNTGPPPSALQGQIPFRQGFEDRHRAAGGFDARQQRPLDSASKQESGNAKSSGIKRFFGL